MDNVMGLFIQIFFMVFLGMVLRRKGLLSNEFQANLSVLITHVILPFSILSSSNRPFDKSMINPLLITVAVAGAYYILALVIGYFLGQRVFPTKPGNAALFTTCTTFANVGFLGFPVINTIFGSEGMIYAVIYNMLYNLFFYTIGTSLLNRQDSGIDIRLSRLLRDPAILTSLISILIYVSPLRFPAFAYDTFSLIGNMITPLSMFLIGASLVGTSIKSVIVNKEALLVSFMRLVFFPLLVLAVAQFFPEYKFVFSVLIVLTSLPVGSLNTIFAKIFNLDVQFASTVTIQSMLLMVVSLPVYLFVLL